MKKRKVHIEALLLGLIAMVVFLIIFFGLVGVFKEQDAKKEAVLDCIYEKVATENFRGDFKESWDLFANECEN